MTWLVGITLGAFVGLLSSFLFLLILRAGFKGSGLAQVAEVLGELTALVTFALGGTWLAGSELLQGADTSDVLTPYLLSFTIVFFAAVCVPFYRLVVRFAHQFAREEAALRESDQP